MILAICTLKLFFEFAHILIVDLGRYVTSNEDMSDSHLLPLDVISKYVIVCCFS